MNDTVSEDVKLEPCPFCGARLQRQQTSSGHWHEHMGEVEDCYATGSIVFDENIAAWNRRAYLAATKPPLAGDVTDETVERLAAYLCDEHDDEFSPRRNASWPEDENDDGKREGGYVAIQPKHVQARAREIARRILAFTRTASPPMPGRGEPEAVTQELVTDLVRECERAMKQRDEALADPTKRGPDGRTHDTTFEHILRQHLDPTYSYYRASRP